MNYSELQTIIELYLGFNAHNNIPLFINLAEDRLNRDIKFRVLENYVTLPLTDGRADLPTDYNVFREVQYNGKTKAYVVAQEWMKGGAAGYTIIGDSIYADTPSVDILYIAKIPALGEGSPNNIILDSYPKLYLYASLVESVAYNLEDSNAAAWQGMYDNALRSTVEDEGRARYGSNLVSRFVRG